MTANLKDMLGRGGATPLAEVFAALSQMLADHPGLRVEEVAAEAALGRISAEALVAPEDLPVHPRSVMDGYAVAAADTFGAAATLPAYLTISGEVKMGEMPVSGPAATECHRIATGGLLPPGSDAVVMLEHTVPAGDNLLEVVKPVAPGGNIIARGDDVRRGESLLPAGHRFRPCDLGLLAGLGINRVKVFARPKVGIISTGDEIVPPDQNPPPGKIRDMNMAGLLAMVRSLGGEAVNCGIVGDREAAFVEQLQRALEQCDLVLFSGGTSVGVGDMGERVLNRLTNPGILIHGVALKPGKPVIIAAHGSKPIFGLPGHPVSATAAFALLVRPLLLGIAGQRRQGGDCIGHLISSDQLGGQAPVVAGSAAAGRPLPLVTREAPAASEAGRKPAENERKPGLGPPADRVPLINLPRPVAQATLRRNLNSAAGRTDLVPVRLQTAADGGLEAIPVLGKSSALSTLVRARGWIIIAAHLQGLNEGSQVEVYNFDS